MSTRFGAICRRLVVWGVFMISVATAVRAESQSPPTIVHQETPVFQQKASAAETEDTDLTVHLVRSEYQSGETRISVLLPNGGDGPRPYRSLYVLPVEARDGQRWGSPLEEVKSRISLAVKKDRQLVAARAKLSPAVGEIQMGSTMTEVAEASDFSHAVTDTFTVNGNVQDVGYGTEFNKAAIEGTVGTLIPEVETLRGIFALQPLWITPFDQADFDTRRGGIHVALLSRAQNKAVDDWYRARLDEAEIVDLRQTPKPQPVREAGPKPVFDVPRLQTTITIDGRLDPGEWFGLDPGRG